MRWLVIKVAWLWHDKGFDVIIGNLSCMWLGRNSMSLEVRLHGGASISRNVIPWPLLVGVHGGAPSI